MKVIDRLHEYLQAMGINNRTAEQDLSLSNGYIGKCLNRDTDIGGELIEKICITYPNLSLEWLVLNQGKMLVKSNSNEDISSSEKLKECLKTKDQLTNLLIEKEVEIKKLKNFRKSLDTKS